MGKISHANWKMVRISELCSLITDGTHQTPTYSENGYIFLSSKNVTTGKIDWDEVKYIPQELHEQLYKRLSPQKNDILLAKNGTTGICAKVDRDVIFDIYVSLALLRPKSMIEPDYFVYAINNPYTKKKFNRHLKGIGVPNLHLSSIKETSIPLPPLDEQKRIAKNLDLASEIVKGYKEQLAELDKLVQSVFYEMFGDPVTNEKGWAIGTIRDVVREVKYGTSRPATEGGKYPYLRMNNITSSGHLDLSNLKQIDIPDNELEKCMVTYGDVLFNRTNSKELVGKTCVYNLQTLMIIAGYIIRVRVNEKMIPEFLSAILNSKYGKNTLYGMCKSIIGQANINAKELQSIKIYVPPIQLQTHFASIVTDIEAQKAKIQHALTEAENLFNSLMQEYFE